ncbi:LysR substrate-binding domain-containing protein [Pseudomonas sp. LRF_L74]|uniref:LysR substrate-binding domain-containing protein n=1 Tax=Pseudomonas sp. LRF_L74 TaxID=3369422 RepID=UPI003F5FA1D8
MDLSSLEIFEAVAAELSITKAAALMGRVQSNVTTRIKALEQQIGTDLFIRDSNRLRLTDDGARFLEYSRRIRALADEAIQAMHPEEPRGTLRLGSMESTAASRLPAVLSRFHRALPQVGLSIVTGTSQSLIDRLLLGDIDCALVAIAAEKGAAVGDVLLALGLEGALAYEEELLLLTPPGVMISDMGSLSLAAFAKGCTYRLLAQNFLDARYGGRALTTHEVGSYHAMMACVAAGQSVCVLPRSLLQLQAEAQNYPIQALAQVPTWLVWRRGFATAALQAFSDTMASGSTGGAAS